MTGTGATAPDRRFANGMFAVYVDPKVVDTSNFFDGEISRYVDFIRATKPVAGVDAVLIPGDPERKMRADRTKNGVPLPDDTWAAIVNTAREVGVSEVSIQRATASLAVIARSVATKQSILLFVVRWIASRSLSSDGASQRPVGSQ